MTVSSAEIFTTLLHNLRVDNSETIASRRDEITKALNKSFRSKEGSTSHQLMVGSYGRYTAVRGVSDLDMLYILPAGLREEYAGDTGPRNVLTRVKDVLHDRYPNTEVRVDQCVVRVQFTSNRFKFEVQPVFENEDKSFSYPDTVAKDWKITKPRNEIRETSESDERTSSNMRKLARMARAWRNAHGITMGGLLIDTLVHRFFATTSGYDSAGTSSYGLMARDFFKFLSEEPNKEYYGALGSGQRVRVKKRFQAKAKKAYNLCVDAIDAEGKSSSNKKWRAVFGTSVPATPSAVQASASGRSFDHTEEFIESKFTVDIRHSLTIDCKVTQKGFRPNWLREMLNGGRPLFANKSLDFTITECSVEEPYDVRWKVLNRGVEAEHRNAIRGQIIKSSSPGARHETTTFKGEHVVECYVIKNGVVVARDRIDVPIRIST